MTALICFVAALAAIAVAMHVVSIVVVNLRLRRGTPSTASPRCGEPAVSLVRPLCGLYNYAAETLASTFALDHPRCEILFCVASADDPIVPVIEDLIAKNA